MPAALFDAPAQETPAVEPPDLSDQSAMHWASLPMKIGKHEWRVVVFAHEMYGPCTQYEFRGPKAPWWKSEKAWSDASRHWRGYDGNHCYSGMPKGLTRLYEANKGKIAELIPSH